VSGNHNSLLEGQVAIITGSGQGIGEQTAKLFAKEGAKVVVTDLDSAKANAVAQQIQSEGGIAISVPGDITNKDFPEKLIQETIKQFGKLNIIVNNAGYTWDAIFHRMTDQQWEAMFAVHNTAPFRLIRASTPYMRDAAKNEMDKNGVAEPRSIVFISSINGLHGQIGQANYATAKAGVLGLMKTITKEWGPFGIRVNAVSFGSISTRLIQSKEEGEFIEVQGQKVALGIPKRLLDNRSHESIPLRRVGSPFEAASSILLICSPFASYISGHCLEVTGGAGI